MVVPAMLVIAVLSTSAVKPIEYVRISPTAGASWHRCPRAVGDHAGAGLADPRRAGPDHTKALATDALAADARRAGLHHSGAMSSSGPSTPGRFTAGFAGTEERRSLASGPHSDSASSASRRGSSHAC